MLFSQTFCNLLLCQIRPQHFLLHRITSGVVLDYTQKCFINVWMALLIPLAPSAWTAHSRIVAAFFGQFLQLFNACRDRTLGAAQQLGYVRDAAMTQFLRFHPCISSSIFFRQRLIELAQELLCAF